MSADPQVLGRQEGFSIFRGKSAVFRGEKFPEIAAVAIDPGEVHLCIQFLPEENGVTFSKLPQRQLPRGIRLA